VQVLRLVDNAHSAAAKLFLDVVVRKGTVNHGEDWRNSRCSVRASQRQAGHKRCGRVLSRATRIPRGAAWGRCVQREL
jgi:hypothetical protein